MASRGLLIVIEGSDGAGKATQYNLLAERLKAVGYDVSKFDFPRYDKDSSYFVRQYLGGEYGPAGKISPYTASLFYALDRYEAAKDIENDLKAGKIVLMNRYVGSNMAFQGAKFEDPVEQRGFFVWEDNLEFELLKIPRPDINIFLRVPAEVSKRLIKERSVKTGVKLDEHEKNNEFLKKALYTYDLLCQLFPKDFTAIDCAKNGQLMSIPAISNLIWDKVKPILPPEIPHSGHSSVVTLSDNADKPKLTSGDGLGDKFTHKFTNASLYLKLNVERQVKSVDPSGLGVWSDYHYKFFTPSGLPKATEQTYKQIMDQIAELHRTMRDKLQAYYERNLLSGNGQPPSVTSLLLPATPLAALTSFNATFSDKAAARVSSQLLANDSQELQWAAQQIYIAAKQMWPKDFRNGLESAGNPEPINNIIAKLSEERLGMNTADDKLVKLLEAAPRQEFDLLAESIYPYSSLSLDEISDEVSEWSYSQKYDSFRQVAADISMLEKITYKFDVVSDQITLNEVINNCMVGNLQVQSASPRLGYGVPADLEAAGIEDAYLDCFDLSLKLFSSLQQADRDDLTAYAALLGHKQRWQFTVDANNLRRLFEHKGSDSYEQLINTLKDKVAEVHPLTWDALGNTQSQASAPARKHRVKPSHRRRPKSKKQNNSSDK